MFTVSWSVFGEYWSVLESVGVCCRNPMPNDTRTLHAISQELCVYGVATISRLLKIIGLFCRILSLLYGSFAKRPVILRSLRIEATPLLKIHACDICHVHVRHDVLKSAGH